MFWLSVGLILEAAIAISVVPWGIGYAFHLRGRSLDEAFAMRLFGALLAFAFTSGTAGILIMLYVLGGMMLS